MEGRQVGFEISRAFNIRWGRQGERDSPKGRGGGVKFGGWQVQAKGALESMMGLGLVVCKHCHVFCT